MIEVNSIVTDTVVSELRVGDRVQAVFDDNLVGTVFSITRPVGEITERGDEALTVEQPPVVTVVFDTRPGIVGIPEHQVTVEFTPQFLRVATWRWQTLDVRKIG